MSMRNVTINEAWRKEPAKANGVKMTPLAEKIISGLHDRIRQNLCEMPDEKGRLDNAQNSDEKKRERREKDGNETNESKLIMWWPEMAGC